MGSNSFGHAQDDAAATLKSNLQRPIRTFSAPATEDPWVALRQRMDVIFQRLSRDFHRRHGNLGPRGGFAVSFVVDAHLEPVDGARPESVADICVHARVQAG